MPPIKLLKFVKVSALPLSAILLASCQTTSLPAQTDTLAFCDAARPIYWSKKDTPKTVAQIKEHNAVGKICGWGKK